MNLTRREVGRGILRLLPVMPVLGWAWRVTAQAESGQKMSPEAAAYQASPKGGEKCSGCAQFVAPDGCKVVSGEISPDGWCKLYVAKAEQGG